MKRQIPQLGLTMGLIAAIAACSSYPKQTDAERLALYREHAGEPVKDFHYFSSGLSGWTPLGDEALAVWTRPRQAYLLELTGPCMDLDYAPAISISNLMGQVSARFDNVYVHGGGSSHFRIPCRIETIRPLDVKALKQAEKELREAKVVEREAQPSGT
ncbi:DUF6491 family protein [Pseudoxanthomonas sangjuensis]|uniref:DUF6491 family protein n=1 Tax=Pseudoxanthomonas sangjuensis TaxID=1503750 RepID=UPI0013919E42|nr:DUF6491 family protein [Pseudoxanthomonas sangjuensis]